MRSNQAMWDKATVSKFSDKILKLIEQGDLETAQKQACKEVIELWTERQKEQVEIAKNWQKVAKIEERKARANK